MEIEVALFNMIHRASFFKADMFVSSGRAFDASQFARRMMIDAAPGQTLAITRQQIALIEGDLNQAYSHLQQAIARLPSTRIIRIVQT